MTRKKKTGGAKFLDEAKRLGVSVSADDLRELEENRGPPAPEPRTYGDEVCDEVLQLRAALIAMLWNVVGGDTDESCAGDCEEKGDHGDGTPFPACAAVRRWAGEAGLEMAAEMDVRWLRRTKDSLAVEAGVSSEVVARETGHSLHVARQHYIQHGAETTARAAAMDDATAVKPVLHDLSSSPGRRKLAK